MCLHENTEQVSHSDRENSARGQTQMSHSASQFLCEDQVRGPDLKQKQHSARSKREHLITLRHELEDLLPLWTSEHLQWPV